MGKILVESKKNNMGFIEGNIYVCEVSKNEHYFINNPIFKEYTHIIGIDKLKAYFNIIKTEQTKLTFDEVVKEIRLNNSKIYTNGFSILKYDKDLNAVVELDKNNNYRDSCAISFKREFYELKKEKSLFEYVLKKYKQGFVIESVECGTKYKYIDGIDYYFSDLSEKYLPNGEISMEEILGEWYAYEE